jgi:ABC-type uncharacterized transport system substrate-binding protein
LLTGFKVRRRDVIRLLSGAVAATPALMSQAQPFPRPVIGIVHLTSLEETRDYLAAFRQGLAGTGFTENANVTIEYRWGLGNNDRLPKLIADLVQRQVSVLVVLESTHGALAAKAATATIPVVFMQGADPVKIGLVDSLSHPGGNLTGINLFLAEVAAKRLELLHELVPTIKSVGYLRNPTNPVFAESETAEVEKAARIFGISLHFMNVSTLRDIEATFAHIDEEPIEAIFVSSDGFLLTHSDEVVTQVSHHSIPAIYGWRQAVALGGLSSYGTYFPDAWRQAGVYTGRILSPSNRRQDLNC